MNRQLTAAEPKSPAVFTCWPRGRHDLVQLSAYR